MRRSALLVVGVWAAMLGDIAVTAAQDSDDKLKLRVEKIDEKLAKALAELATKYSEDSDVEAAHFFAECFRGLGKKDDKIHAIWLDWELKVYLGKEQGGKPLEKAAPIGQKLASINGDYKKVLEELLALAKKERRSMSETEAKLFRECAVKYELTRGAQDYIKTIKRINELRRAMGLRGVLWDFENSAKMILASACWADVLDTLGSVTEKNKESAFYSEDSLKLATESAAAGYRDIGEWAEYLRGFALSRSPLLNPNSRRLWLGHWKRFDGFTAVSAFQIPQLPYREDIPTPSQRHDRGTITKDWIDTEETFEAGGKKFPLARYPHDGETNLPWYFGMVGAKGTEGGWSKEEHEFTKTAGLPIMLRFFGAAKLGDMEAKLTTKSGKDVACRTYTNGNERVPGIGEWPTVLLVPEGELEKGATYTVSIRAKVNGSAFEKTWCFTTRK